MLIILINVNLFHQIPCEISICMCNDVFCATKRFSCTISHTAQTNRAHWRPRTSVWTPTQMTWWCKYGGDWKNCTNSNMMTVGKERTVKLLLYKVRYTRTRMRARTRILIYTFHINNSHILYFKNINIFIILSFHERAVKCWC